LDRELGQKSTSLEGEEEPSVVGGAWMRGEVSECRKQGEL